MSNRINTYYVFEDMFDDRKTWIYVETHFTLSQALACFEVDYGYPARIVRYAPKRLPEVVRQWDAEGKRIV